MTNFIYTLDGKCVGFWEGNYVWEISGSPVGQKRDSHIYNLDGRYIGELYNDELVLDMGKGALGGISSSNPGSHGGPGNPGGKSLSNPGYEDVWHKLLE